MHTRTWHVTINLFEDDGRTRARAVLHTDAGPERHHDASARKHPTDREVPEIGDELAVSRALAGLAHDLLDAAIDDIAANDPTDATTTGAAAGWSEPS